jgi:hypothetical protein
MEEEPGMNASSAPQQLFAPRVNFTLPQRRDSSMSALRRRDVHMRNLGESEGYSKYDYQAMSTMNRNDSIYDVTPE